MKKAKKQRWKRLLGLCLVLCAVFLAMPQLAVEAASYTDHEVSEGTELFDIAGKNFSYLSYDGVSKVETDGNWYTYTDSNGFHIQNTVSTPQTGQLTGRWIRVTFNNVGTMNGRQVKGVMEFTDMEGNNIYNSFLGLQRPTNAICISSNNFWSGFLQSFLPQVTLTVRLYYADTGEQINMSGMYTTISSLNGDTTQCTVFGGAWEGVKLNYNGTVNAYHLPDGRGANPWVFSPKTSLTTGIVYHNGWYMGQYYDFDDALGGESFLKSAVSFQIPDKEVSLTYRSNESGLAWYTFNLSPFGSSAIPPEKLVENTSGQNIDGQALYPGDSLVYRTNQRMEILGVDGTARYKSFVMTDTIPDGLTITGVKLQQKAAGSSTYTDIPTSAYSYRTTNNADGTKTVTLTLANPNSANPWAYSGETLSMAVTCRVEEKMWDYVTFGRDAAVSINGNNRGTNSVTNAISYRILTSAVNGTIDETVTRIERGGSRTIHFTPNEGYYLKSLTVDGTAVPVILGLDSYTFSNITGNHEIQAVFAKNPVITVTKQIDRSTVVWAKGDPVFTYKISGKDYLGISRTYYRMIAFEEGDGLDTKSMTVKIPAGEWTVTELETNDWGLTSVTAGASCKVQGTAGILDTRNSDTAGVTFSNEVTDYSNYTHNGYQVNQMK